MAAADTPPTVPAVPPKKARGCLFYGLVILGCLLLVAGLTAFCSAWWVKRQINAPPITPVELTAKEQAVLDEKLEALHAQPEPDHPPPEKVITISEKEINALLANNTDLGDKAHVSLERDTITARWNIPVEDGAPVLGGKTLRGHVKMRATLEDQRLVLQIKDVTVAGVSLPNAWLGGVKGVDLVAEYAAQDEALKAFVDGIAGLRVENGQITIILAD